MENKIILEISKAELIELIRDTMSTILKIQEPDEQKSGRLYTTSEVASIVKVKKDTVRDWAKKGKIKFRKIGRPYLFTEEDIRDAMKVKQPSKLELINQVIKQNKNK